MTLKNTQADLTSESSSNDMIATSLRLELDKMNLLPLLVALVPLVTFACITNLSAHDSAVLVRGWCDFVLSSGVVIVGLTLVAFSVVSSYSRPEMMARMGAVRNDHTGISYLKTHLLSLANVPMYFITLAMFCWLIKIFAMPCGLLSLLTEFLPSGSVYTMKLILSRCGIVVIGTGFWFGLCLLKSFVFNVYSLVMMSARWDTIRSKVGNPE